VGGRRNSGISLRESHVKRVAYSGADKIECRPAQTVTAACVGHHEITRPGDFAPLDCSGLGHVAWQRKVGAPADCVL